MWPIVVRVLRDPAVRAAAATLVGAVVPLVLDVSLTGGQVGPHVAQVLLALFGL